MTPTHTYEPWALLAFILLMLALLAGSVESQSSCRDGVVARMALAASHSPALDTEASTAMVRDASREWGRVDAGTSSTVAQRSAHRTHNPEVAGSTPAGATGPPGRVGNPPVKHARPGGSPLRALWLARVCHLEAAWREADCAAIYWIARKRARGGDWLAQLRAYSALDKQRTARAREIRRYPWGDVEGKGKRWNRRWRAQRQYALRLVRGEVADPCPEATDWGGVEDVPRARHVLARCSGQEHTANRLYFVRAR